MSIGLLSSRFGESLFYYRDIAKSKRRIKCTSSNHKPCQARPTLVNIKCSEPPYYPFSVSVNKCCGSCNTIDDPYANVCVPSKVKNMSKVNHLITGINKKKIFKCRLKNEIKFRLNDNISN